MTHQVIVEHGEQSMLAEIPCDGQDCPLCASTAEERAKIAFVKADAVPHVLAKDCWCGPTVEVVPAR